MEVTNFVNTIKILVAEDKLPEAILKLREFMQGHESFNEIIIQSARYKDIQTQLHTNTVPKEYADIEKNKIRLAVLYIADLIANETDIKTFENKVRFLKNWIRIRLRK